MRSKRTKKIIEKDVDEIKFNGYPLRVSQPQHNTTVSLALPTSPALRETFEIESLVDWKSLPAFRNAVAALRRTVESAGVRSAQSVCIRANGEIVLISCGKRGAIKQLWNFGDPLVTGR